MTDRYKIAIIGSTGMLGNSAYKVLKDKCDLVLTARTQKKFDILEEVHGGTEKHKKLIFDVTHPTIESLHYRVNKLIEDIGDVDLVLNCLGVLNKFAPGMTPTAREYYAINTEFPIYLSKYYGRKLIHPSTDCVFDGLSDKPHSEDSPYSPSYGLYGYAKMFADEVVKEQSLVLRCCLIGDELEENAFQMFSWVKRQTIAGGYTKHIISPITGMEFTNVCWRILTEKINISPMILHLATPPISKYDILRKYIEIKNLNVELHEDSSVSLYKVLETNYPDLLKQLRIVSFNEMMEAL